MFNTGATDIDSITALEQHIVEYKNWVQETGISVAGPWTVSAPSGIACGCIKANLAYELFVAQAGALFRVNADWPNAQEIKGMVDEFVSTIEFQPAVSRKQRPK